MYGRCGYGDSHDAVILDSINTYRSKVTHTAKNSVGKENMFLKGVGILFYSTSEFEKLFHNEGPLFCSAGGQTISKRHFEQEY
jgi:hypothetical protein